MKPNQHYEEFQGYLGMILGSAAGALLHSGYTRKEIHDLLDMAFRAHDTAPNSSAMKEASELIEKAAGEMIKGASEDFLC